MLTLALGNDKTAPLRILCLGAHSDDIEIGCGGTLLRLLAERPGSTIDWVVMSATGLREMEASESAAAFLSGVETKRVQLKSFRESYFPYVAAELKDFFEELKGQVKPDVIFCHRRHDLHQDHRTVSELTWNTWRNHLILEYEIPKYEGDLGTPSIFVPLSKKTADRKVDLLLEHFKSQATRAWFRRDTFDGLMSIRGIECNASEGRAEAFYVRKVVL